MPSRKRQSSVFSETTASDTRRVKSRSEHDPQPQAHQGSRVGGGEWRPSRAVYRGVTGGRGRGTANRGGYASEGSVKSVSGDGIDGRNQQQGRGDSIFPRVVEESHEEDGQEGEEGGEPHKRILALHAPWGGNIAAAFYDPEERKIQVLEDTKDTTGWDLAVLVMEQVHPDLVIMSSGTDRTLAAMVDTYKSANNIDLRIELLNAKSCSLFAASRHLATVVLPGDARTILRDLLASDHVMEERSGIDSISASIHHERARDQPGFREDEGAGMGKFRLNMLKLGCWVNVDAPLAVVATGILVDQVKKDKRNSASAGDQWCNNLTVTGIESLQLERHMFINKDALTSLSIFDVEAHAFLHANRTKEAASILGLLDRTETPLGRKLFHTWHLRPLLDLDEIAARHDAVELFIAPENLEVMTTLRTTLKKVCNIPRILTRLQIGRGNWRDWRNLLTSLYACRTIQESTYELEGNMRTPIVDKMMGICDADLATLSRDISMVIDFDNSQIETRVMVKPGIDEELDNLMRDYEGLPSVLCRDQVPPEMSEHVTAVYFPQLGYLLAIEVEPGSFEGDPPTVPGWDIMFFTPEKLYYKNRAMHDLDDYFGDIHADITNREIDIIQQLTVHMNGYEQRILHSMNLIAELDCLLALAQAAQVHGLTRPLMVEEPVLKIFGGTHMLQELWTKPYIRNDTMIHAGAEAPDGLLSMMVVTGANGSGKSAYGKQIALIVYLAQIGSFVPAEAAEIGICDKSGSSGSFVMLTTRESASKNASAFMIDLAQVSQALRGATERSLLILDEFGKGTTPADGAGLLAGVIEHLVQGPCPRAVVLTHFHEIFSDHFLGENMPIMQCHMESVMMQDTSELRYLYRVTPHPCRRSYAAECALQNGIPKRIVDRARYITDCIENFEVNMLIDEALTERNKRELEAAEDLAKRFLSWDIDDDFSDPLEELREMIEKVKSRHALYDSASKRGSSSIAGTGEGSQRGAGDNDHKEDDGNDGNDGERIAPSNLSI